MEVKVNIRKKIHQILCNILIKKEYSNIALSKVINDKSFTPKDKALIYQIVFGTLKQLLYLEYVINKITNSEKTDIKIKILLWMSVYQIHFLDRVPGYAIISQAVNIAKEINPKLSGLVNAVLRNVLDNDKIFKVEEKGISSKLILFSFPEWLYQMLEEQFGKPDALAIAEDSLNEAKRSYRVNVLKISRQDLLNEYGEKYNLKPSKLSDYGIISDKSLIQTVLFKEGYIFAQDEASMLVAEVLNPKSGDIVLDMCAAPGGKTTHLAQLMNNDGVIDAYDIYEHKISLIEKNCQRLGITIVNPILSDVLKISETKKYDRILLDAACSGFGVLKRKPEIKYRQWTNELLNQLIEKQKSLLDKAYKLLKPNGVLVYSTCTFNIFENQKQIDNFIKRYEDLELVEERQIFGYKEECDGFYISRITKKG